MGGYTYSRYVSKLVCMNFCIIVVFIVYSSANKWLQFCIMAIGIYFAYISTEKYEVSIYIYTI